MQPRRPRWCKPRKAQRRASSAPARPRPACARWILIKDNHIALAGDVRTAIERAKAHAGHLVKIEVEVDTLSQLEQALAIGVDAVLLDNMTVEELRQAVAMTGGRAITEASGRITAETAKAIAATGVDLISAGWLTHSSAALDIGLDYLGLNRQAA